MSLSNTSHLVHTHWFFLLFCFVLFFSLCTLPLQHLILMFVRVMIWADLHSSEWRPMVWHSQKVSWKRNKSILSAPHCVRLINSSSRQQINLLATTQRQQNTASVPSSHRCHPLFCCVCDAPLRPLYPFSCLCGCCFCRCCGLYSISGPGRACRRGTHELICGTGRVGSPLETLWSLFLGSLTSLRHPFGLLCLLVCVAAPHKIQIYTLLIGLFMSVSLPFHG